MIDPLSKTSVSILVTTDGTSVTYSKPASETKNDAYQVKSDGDLWLDPSKLSFPVTIVFTVVSDKSQYVISAIGFANVTESDKPPVPDRYTAKGLSCGGCFTLDDGIGSLSVGVIDSGLVAPSGYGYSFKVWLQDTATGKELPNDPRIYNRGQVGGG